MAMKTEGNLQMADWNQLSILEIAETLLKQNDKPMTFLELFQAIGELKNLSDEEKSDIISQVYADFIVSAKFVYVGDDLWDLKGRQSIDLWDKDGAYYGETTDFQEDEEETEKEYEEDEFDEEIDEETDEEIDEEEEESEDEYEKEPDFDEFEEEEEEDIDYDGFEDEEAKFVEDEDDIAPEEDEFDSDKYNEYMDDYEKMYDK